MRREESSGIRLRGRSSAARARGARKKTTRRTALRKNLGIRIFFSSIGKTDPPDYRDFQRPIPTSDIIIDKYR
jgi:hypothetical protein